MDTDFYGVENSSLLKLLKMKGKKDFINLLSELEQKRDGSLYKFVKELDSKFVFDGYDAKFKKEPHNIDQGVKKFLIIKLIDEFL